VQQPPEQLLLLFGGLLLGDLPGLERLGDVVSRRLISTGS